MLGYARRFKAEIVNYADDFAVLGKASAAEMLTAVKELMKRLKLPMNAEKTRCCRVPEEPMTCGRPAPQPGRGFLRHGPVPRSSSRREDVVQVEFEAGEQR